VTVDGRWRHSVAVQWRVPIRDVNPTRTYRGNLSGTHFGHGGVLRATGQSWSSNTTSGKPATGATFPESSMLERKTMNTQIEPVEEVNILPELISA